jgi:hypothetical protein
VGLQTGDDKRFLAGIDSAFPGLDKVIAADGLATSISPEEQAHGIPTKRPHWVPFAKGEGFGEYWRDPQVAIDWSESSVADLERRSRLPAGTPRKTYFRNREFFFKPALTYSVVSSGRVSARMMPPGWAWSDKGSAIFIEDGKTSDLFLLGYLNSALATYFMKKLVNTTATAHAGYVEKLPYRTPPADLRKEVEDRVARIVEQLKADPDADVSTLRNEIDERIFDLFQIRDSREAVLRFYDQIGKSAADESEGDAQEATE